MALSYYKDVSFFEESQISTDISDINSFFETYGVYYQEDAEIGNLATSLTERRITDADFDELKRLTESNSRLKTVIAPFIKNRPDIRYQLGSDKGAFYALTIGEDVYSKVVIYILKPMSKLQIVLGSHKALLRGVLASNALFQIPYSYLRKLKEPKEVSINFEDGGILVVHPRLAISLEDGLAAAFCCRRS